MNRRKMKFIFTLLVMVLTVGVSYRLVAKAANCKNMNAVVSVTMKDSDSDEMHATGTSKECTCWVGDYTIELKTVRADHVDKILKGDKVVETVRDQQIGEVVDVVVVPSYNIVTNNDTGERYVRTYPALNQSLDDLIETVEEGTEILDVQSTDDTEELIYDYYNVKVTIRDKVKKTEKGYSVNGFNIIVGDIVHFRVPEYVNSGYCVKIVEVNE